MAIVTVPETSVHKNNRSVFAKHEVRAARYLRRMEAEAKPASMD